MKGISGRQTRLARYGSAFAAAVIASAPAYADDAEFNASVQWAATYEATPLAPGEAVHIGTMRGLFVDADGQGPFGVMSVTCPYLESLIADGTVNSVVAHCILASAAGDTIFLAAGCAGNPHTAGCEGNYTFTGGLGAYAGISGEGGLVWETIVTNTDGSSSAGITNFYGWYRYPVPTP